MILEHVVTKCKNLISKDFMVCVCTETDFQIYSINKKIFFFLTVQHISPKTVKLNNIKLSLKQSKCIFFPFSFTIYHYEMPRSLF